jgi:hypothetical protein
MRHLLKVGSMEERETDREGPLEIALVGDLTEAEAELTDKLLSVEPGSDALPIQLRAARASAF